MFVDEGLQPCDIFIAHQKAFLPQWLQRRIHVDRIPQDDDVDHQPKRTQLILLALAVTLAQFAALAMEDGPGQAVPALATVELSEDSPPPALVINVSSRS